MFERLGIAVLGVLMPLNLMNFKTNELVDVSANPIIVDLDLCTDVDDAVAIRMATVLDDLDVCSLKAVGVCTTGKEDRNAPAKTAQGILEYKGYSNVKVGYAHYEEPDESKYWDVCSTYANQSYQYIDAVDVYKDVLKSCANPVTIVTTGYLNNIKALLEDEEGYNLVKENCARIVIQGGTYPSGWDNNFGFTKQAADAVKYVDENAPCEILYIPGDVAGIFNAGEVIQKNDPNDPTAKALTAWGTENGRSAWDPTAVLIASLPDGIFNYDFRYVNTSFTEKGEVTFEDTIMSNRKVVRRFDEISIQQYQNMIEGILGAEY